MKLKLQKILLNKELLKGFTLSIVNKNLIHSNSFNKLRIHLYHPNIDVNTTHIFSIPPTSSFLGHKNVGPFNDPVLSLDTKIIDKNWTDKNVVDISKKLSKLSLLDVFNWLKFLSITNFKKHNNYVLALYNVDTIINNKYPHQSLDLQFSSKYDVLTNVINNQKTLSYNLNTNNLMDIKTFNKKSHKVSALIGSHDRYFLDSQPVSNHKMHQYCFKLINSLRKQVLNLEMKSSKPKVCPYCHHLTYSRFRFCQYCGKQIAQ